MTDLYPEFIAPYAFTVCRVEPENNLDMIMEAFKSITHGVSELVIVGNWSHSSYSRAIYANCSGYANIHLLEPIYDPEKLNRLRGKCSLYLHGHSCGGTNPSLVEAMYLGLPIVAYDVNFNRETTEGRAWYFSSSAQLRELCGSYDADSARAVADKMREIALRRYRWERISECYAELF